MVTPHFVRRFSHAALSPDPDLAIAALMIARLEYPRLDAAPYLDRLDALGRDAAARVAAADPAADAPLHVDPEAYARVMALNRYLFDELQFVGNQRQYDDPRNSFLNEVLDRRTGIPISLALMYLEVARRAGLQVEGVNFPGHFLVRCPARRSLTQAEDLIIDAFHGGAILSEDACRGLLRRHAGEAAVFETTLLKRANKQQILTRMLVNLKRLYVRMRSFSQARDVMELLLSVDPTAPQELRDRGLIAYHLGDLSAALRDLQAYLRLAPSTRPDDEERAEQAQAWEHVKTLRKRLATFN